MSLQSAIARVDEILAQIDGPATATAPGAPTRAVTAQATAASASTATTATFADQLSRRTSGALPAGAEPFRSMIDRASRYWGVDSTVIAAVIEHESRFDPSATNPTSGAAGLMQLMPQTARGLGVSNPYDPAQNIWGGAHLLSTELQRFHGDLRLALAAYSAGPSAVERYGGVPPYAETQRYVQSVLSNLQSFSAVPPTEGSLT